MTWKEAKEKNIQKLLKLAENNTILAPPCCNDVTLDLFNMCFHLWNTNDRDFSDYASKNYPEIKSEDIAELENYLSDAHKYLIDICCTFAQIYQSYAGPRYNYGIDQKYCDILIRTCLRRYPWLTEEYINENLWQICRLCNW